MVPVETYYNPKYLKCYICKMMETSPSHVALEP